jgi:hypothetical protein
MIPLPTINSTCAYTFTGAFQALNGIYTLGEMMSFNEALASGVDFIDNLYIPAGLTAAQYTTDAVNYKNDTILCLTRTNTTAVPTYMPASLLATVPDPMIGCYNNLALGIVLGLFADQTQLTWIVNEINNIVAATVGISAPSIKLYSLGTQYMRVVDYEALVAQRTDAITPYATLYQKLQDQIALTEAAQNLNVYYKNTLLALAAQTTGSGGS